MPLGTLAAQGTSWIPVPVDPLGGGYRVLKLQVLMFSWEYQHSSKQEGAARYGCAGSIGKLFVYRGGKHFNSATEVTAEWGSRAEGRDKVTLGDKHIQLQRPAVAVRSVPGILAVGWFFMPRMCQSYTLFLSIMVALMGSSYKSLHRAICAATRLEVGTLVLSAPNATSSRQRWSREHPGTQLWWMKLG